MSLVASPIAINILKSNQTAGVVVYGSGASACANSSVETVIGRLGCQRTAGDRTMNGSGAVFVRVGQ